jgi:hypothetical protein
VKLTTVGIHIMKSNMAIKKSIITPSISASMSKPISKQKGLTMISWIVVIVFLLFQGVIAMNVIPVYITDSNVKKIMAALPDDINAREASTQQLKNMVLKRLNINSVYSIKPENIKVKKGRDEHIVTIEYEPRGKLVGNLEFIVSFKHEAIVKNR